MVTGGPGRIRVAIIEDQREIREGLAALIDATAGFACTGSFGSMEEALERLGRQAVGETPDVALVDIGLPGMSGIHGLRVLRERIPAASLLMLTVYDDDERIFEALCAGAGGYLLKKTPPERLIESLKEAASGGAPISPEIARKVIALFREVRPAAAAGHDLTPHETRLLRMLVEGHNYKTAAAELGVSVNTVAFHMKSVYEKLQVHSKSEAVAKALRHRIVT